MNKIRIIISRILIGWWIFLGGWLVVFPLLWLVFGSKEIHNIKDFISDVTESVWGDWDEQV